MEQPVVEAVMNGHVMQDVIKDKKVVDTICRLDKQPWPCSRILEARKEAVHAVPTEKRDLGIQTFAPPKPFAHY